MTSYERNGVVMLALDRYIVFQNRTPYHIQIRCEKDEGPGLTVYPNSLSIKFENIKYNYTNFYVKTPEHDWAPIGLVFSSGEAAVPQETRE